MKETKRALGRLLARLRYGFFGEDFLEPLLAPLQSPVIFEFGAHQGEDTVRMTRWLHGDYRYFAWEPDPRHVGKLRSAVANIPHVTVVEAAVGEEDGRSTFNLAMGGSEDNRTPYCASSLLKPSAHMKREIPWLTFDESTEVDVRSVDSFCREHGVGRIDLIWADVQGAEKQLVAGATAALRRTRYLFLEHGPVPLYEGEWTFDEMVDTLGADWRLAMRFPNDVLFYNARLAQFEQMAAWRRFFRACVREMRSARRVS